MKKLSYCVLLFSLFSISACSNFLDKFERYKSKNSTEVHFSSSRAHSIVEKSVLLGGLLVYAVSSTGMESLYLDDEVDSGTMTLLNDSYKFFAVGWDGTQLTGNTYCGLGTSGGSSPGASIALEGTPVVISLNLTTADCATSNFSDPLFNDGANFIPLTMVFCGAATNLSSKTASSACTAGEESAMFLLGNNTAVISDHNGTIDEQTLLYTADTLGAGEKQLYSTSSTGTSGTKTEIKLNTAINGTAGVTRFRATPSGSYVVYIADQDNSIPQLYVTPINEQSPTLLSSAITGVVDFQISPDSSKIVYVADENSSGRLEVYSINLDGSNFTHLNATMAGTTGVKIVSGEAKLQIAPNNSTVVYIAEQDTPGDDELYKATIGVAATTVKLNNTPVANGDVSSFEITPDGNYVVFLGDLLVDNKPEVFSTPLPAGTPQTKISSNSGTLTSVNYFYVDKDYDFSNSGTGKVAYYADSISTNIQELHSVDPNGSNHVTITNVGGTTGDGVRQFWFSRDGSQLAYTSQLVSDSNRTRLFIVNVDGTGNTELTDPSAFTGTGMPAPSSNHTLEFTDDDSQIVYIADQDGGNEQEVWVVNSDGTGRTKLSGTMTTNGNASYIKLGGINNDIVVYLADQNTDTQDELFSVGISGTPTATAVNPALAIGYSIPNNGFHVLHTADKVLYQAKLNTFTAEELYVKTIGGSNAKVGNVTTYGTPIGKYKIHLLSYNGAPNGVLFDFVESISSACLNGPASDGNFTMSTLKIPTSITTSTQPIAVAIEIFPRASTCTGSSIVELFPMGLANTSFSTTNAKLVGDGSTNLRLFIND